MLTVDQLSGLVDSGAVDTVLVVFPDLQGRLLGKRVRAGHFLDELPRSGGAVEACNYLLAVDVDMTVLEGFRYANWDRGYGDFECRPDLSTLRLIPWLEGTALVMCDLYELDGSPVEVSPRRILRRQIERAEAAGYRIRCGTELEFFLFEESYRTAWRRGFRDLTPSSDYILDYHVLQTTRDEWFLREVRNAMAGAGLPVEFSKGEAGLGQHEINFRYADALACADHHTIYKNGIKEMAVLRGCSVTFMAKPSMDDVGSSCHVHSSVWSPDGAISLMPDESGHDLSPLFRNWLGGLVATAAELTWCWAPYVNSYKRYQSGSWAPTAIGWGRDNRTLGLRVVGHGSGMRVESRIPGADCNPYLALAATIAGGLHGIEADLDPGEPYVGNGYTADLPRIPRSLPEAIDRFRNSEVAADAFGEEVHWHLAHLATEEWEAFCGSVTDWELRRGFERL
jgi:glutamine synthetase